MIVEVAFFVKIWLLLPASRLVFYAIVDNTKMEKSMKTYATVNGRQGCSPVNPHLLEM